MLKIQVPNSRTHSFMPTWEHNLGWGLAYYYTNTYLYVLRDIPPYSTTY